MPLKNVYLNVTCLWNKHSLNLKNEYICSNKYSIEETRDGYKVAMRLVVKKFRQDDVGSYSCISSNSLGKVEGISRLYSKWKLQQLLNSIKFLVVIKEINFVYYLWSNIYLK